MNEMTYKQFLTYLSDAYLALAKKQSNTAFICLVLDGDSSYEERQLSKLFKESSGFDILDSSLDVYRSKLQLSIENAMIKFDGAFHPEKLQNYLKTRLKNPNSLRGLLLEEWAKESVLE